MSRFRWGIGSATFSTGNYFAYLTIQSNIAYAAISVVAGIWLIRHRVDPPWLTNLRAVVLSCTVSAGVVFAFLIEQAGEQGYLIVVPWSDRVLHFVLPAFALIDWIAAPGRRRASWRAIAFVLGYTVVWGLLTLVRGALAGWYPYFFLDPVQLTGFGQFVGYCGIALTLFAAISSGLIGLSRLPPFADRRGRKENPRVSSEQIRRRTVPNSSAQSEAVRRR